MKPNIKVLLMLLFAVSSFTHAQSGWVQQTSGTLDWLADVYFVDTQTGYAVGSDSSTVLKTTNGGSSWIKQTPGFFGSNPAVYFINVNTGFIVSQGSSGSYRTTNGGLNWTAMTSLAGGGNDIMFANPLTGYVASAGSQVKKSTNGGISWTNINVPTSMSFYSVFTLNESIVYFGPGGAYFFKTSNGGDNFQQHGLTSFVKNLYFIDENTGFAACEHYIVKTTNGGSNFSWTQQIYAYRTTFDDLQMINADTGYAIGNNFFDSELGKIYKTTNGGLNWNNIHTANIPLNSLSFQNANTGYVVGQYGTILKTTTGGETVTFTLSGTIRFSDNNQPVTSGKVKAVKYDHASGNIIVVDSAVIQPNGAYILPGVPSDSLDIMAFQDDEDYAQFVPTYYESTIFWQNSTTLYPTANLSNVNINVFRNSQGPENFHIGGNVSSGSDIVNASIKGAIVYAKYGNLFKGYSVSSLNGSYQVGKLGMGAYELIVNRMGFNTENSNAQITTVSLENVNFTLSNSTLPVDPPETTPDKFLLSQNYPNPFNPVTKIIFDVPADVNGKQYVTLVVYDALGKEIKTLVNELLSTGRYEIDFDGTGLPSGVYFYRLSSASFFETKKMLMIK